MVINGGKAAKNVIDEERNYIFNKLVLLASIIAGTVLLVFLLYVLIRTDLFKSKSDVPSSSIAPSAPAKDTISMRREEAPLTMPPRFTTTRNGTVIEMCTL